MLDPGTLHDGWRMNPIGSMSGKWFAESYDDAILFGQRMGHGGDIKFSILEIDIPEEVAKNAHRVQI